MDGRDERSSRTLHEGWRRTRLCMKVMHTSAPDGDILSANRPNLFTNAATVYAGTKSAQTASSDAKTQHR